MDSQSTFRASSASLAISLKDFRTEDQPEEDQTELDLAEPLAAELNSVSADGLSEAEEMEATVGNEPLSIYLKEIRSFQLLTHQQEIAIAKLREDGESKILKSILSTPVASRHVLDLADKVQNDVIRLSDVIEGLPRGDEAAGAPVRIKLDTRDGFLKSVRSIRRRLRNIEALQRKAQAKKRPNERAGCCGELSPRKANKSSACSAIWV